MNGRTWVAAAALFGAGTSAVAQSAGTATMTGIASTTGTQKGTAVVIPTVSLDDAQWIADAAMARAVDTAKWSAAEGAPSIAGPFPLLRKTFSITSASPITRATLVATALGSYHITLNGTAVSPGTLAPDWTDYRKRLLFQTYDVTKLVRRGKNAIGAMLGEGWYGSPVGTAAYGYGPPPVRLKAMLLVTHANGTTERVATDATWRSTSGPVLASRIYDGETFDARHRPAGWDRATFDDKTWTPVQLLKDPSGINGASTILVSEQQSPRIQRTRTLESFRRVRTHGDTTIYDVGQNMVGWVRFRAAGPAGATVQLRHAEVLTADSTQLMRANLRTAAATDLYTLDGHGAQQFEPHFTYHGFRYVEVVASHGVKVDQLTGVVFNTDAPETITFESSNPTLARLWQNAVWSLRGNLMSVPTDCPQRSERFGWLGDAAAFWPTAVYLMDLRNFTGKWLQDLRDAQDDIRRSNMPGATPTDPEERPDSTVVGCFPSLMLPPGAGCGGPGWSDAGVLVPYAAYHQYGDTAMVRAHWASMDAYMQFIARNNPDALWTVHAGGYGDWYPADPSQPTGKRLIATAFWAADALAMRDMARGLGDRAAEARYDSLYTRIRTAFAQRFISANGEVGEKTEGSSDAAGQLLAGQTSDVLALRYGLVPDSLRAKVTQHLLDNIAHHDGHLATGFLGTPRLLPVLSEQGQDEAAYALLLQHGTPSWFGMIDDGATTMWEKWDGMKQPERTSFNHYSYGAVVEWLVKYAVGIGQDTSSSAFTRIVIRPHPDPKGRITHLGARYRSPVGEISSAWTMDPAVHTFVLTVTLPAGTHARVDVPTRRGNMMTYESHDVGGGTHTFRTSVE